MKANMKRSFSRKSTERALKERQKGGNEAELRKAIIAMEEWKQKNNKILNIARPFKGRNTRSYELKAERWSGEHKKRIRLTNCLGSTTIPPDRTSGNGLMGFQFGSRKYGNTSSRQRIILEEYATLLKNKSLIYERNWEYPEYWLDEIGTGAPGSNRCSAAETRGEFAKSSGEAQWGEIKRGREAVTARDTFQRAFKLIAACLRKHAKVGG